MPVYRFKSFEKARRALWVFEPDAEYYKRVEEFLETAYNLAKPVYPKGIFKYKSIDDPQRLKDLHIILLKPPDPK